MSVFDDKSKKRTSMSDDIFSAVPTAMKISKALGMPTPADDIKRLKGYSDAELENMDRASIEKLRKMYKRRSLYSKIFGIFTGIEALLFGLFSLTKDAKSALFVIVFGVVFFAIFWNLSKSAKKKHDHIDNFLNSNF